MGPISSLVWDAIVSKVVNDCVDITKEKIKKANNNRRDKTVESRIYQFTVDVLNNMTCSHYEKEKKMDTIYDTVEKLLNSVKTAENVVEEKIVAILKPLKFVGTTNEDILQNFEEAFYKEITRKSNQDLVVIIGLKNSFNNKKNTLILLYKSDETIERLSKIEQMLQAISENKVYSHKEKENHEIISETKKYLDRWNSNMFLNNPNKRDKNPCIAIKLKEVYFDSQLPHYTWKDSKDIETDLKDLLSEYIIEDNEKMLLILGQPGIGKSTLITWITANYSNDNILVYTFSSLEDLVWQKQNNNDDIVDTIVKKLNLSYQELENKILVLDGFDEVNINSSARSNILNKVYSSWKSNILLKNTLLIITCRENYIQNIDKLRCTYITLQAWDEQQIDNFCNLYQEKTKIEISQDTRYNILKNKEILGIPLLLYMTLALNITIENEGSMVDVYDKIFALDGGIYDRCINNIEYGNSGIHRISIIKKQIHKLSRKIAIWMFEHEPVNAFIPITEYHRFCNNLDEELKNAQNESNFFTKDDILIGSFFKLIKHCEGNDTNQLYFVHRSIYQYFVAETIFSSIKYASKTLTDDSQKSLAKNIVQYLKIGEIGTDATICDFLKRKTLKLYQKFGEEKQKNFYEWLDNSVCRMIKVGMFYYTRGNISDYKNIIKKELTCFENLITIINLFLDICNRKFILQNVNMEMFSRYIFLLISKEKKHNLSRMYLNSIRLININLREANITKSNLESANLEGAILKGANLESANLENAILADTNLEGANLKGAILMNVDLEGANLKDANLKDANLKHVFLENADLTDADLEGTNLESAILIEANLKGANLKDANLKDANLEGANLKNANLEDVNLRGADLEGANLEDADFNYFILFYFMLF